MSSVSSDVVVSSIDDNDASHWRCVVERTDEK